MKDQENNWHLGEAAILSRTSKPLKKSGPMLYEHYIGSRYICVREDSDAQRGILVKVLGKSSPEHISMVCGQPFCRDDREELFRGMRYSSYPFPSEKDVKEVIEILRSNPELLKIFEDALQHVNPRSKFWVSETAQHLLFLKKPLCYDTKSDSLCDVADDETPYRITIVYFHKGKLFW